MNARLQALKDALHVEWGELATMLDVSRSWIDQMRGGTKPGPKVERRLQALELTAGLRTAPTEESLLCESPAEYVAGPRPKESGDKTDQIIGDMKAMHEELKSMRVLLDAVAAALLRAQKPKE